ncbi:MAG: type III-B CRISPR module-associated protein Cmr5 [Firmicutes bacterium]|jgi:CRISPR-associated protein Cmr5|nr:type III-B CRISPR module-associated protein Cmr5 [Bacillota bacterium]
MKTLDQKRANNAWEVVKELEAKAESAPSQKDWNDLYASYVTGLPATIISCGIGQAAASLLSAAKGAQDKPHYRLYKDLENWLCQDDKIAPYPNSKPLMEAIVKNDREHYMWAQAEALAWLEWLKKFAVAYLKTEPAKGGES